MAQGEVQDVTLLVAAIPFTCVLGWNPSSWFRGCSIVPCTLGSLVFSLSERLELMAPNSSMKMMDELSPCPSKSVTNQVGTIPAEYLHQLEASSFRKVALV